MKQHANAIRRACRAHVTLSEMPETRNSALNNRAPFTKREMRMDCWASVII